jgi:acetyl esterase/lipase
MSLRDRIDPEVRTGMDAYLAAAGPGGLSAIPDILERRARMAELNPVTDPPADGITATDHRVGAAGVLLRVYRPDGLAGPAPLVYYIHGGGMVTGSVAVDDLAARALAARVGCVVASIDYRLAPEYPHPFPVEDCYDGLVWAAAELGIDPARVARYGPSAGGGLAAGTALLARDRGGPAVALQMLIYPMVDDRSVTPSSRENTGFGAWSREANIQGWAALLGSGDVSPYAAPARSTDLSGLPPAYVDVGELDLFRDEDIAYATRLMQAGVPVELHVYPGGVHGGENYAPDSALARRVVGYRTDALQRALGL